MGGHQALCSAEKLLMVLEKRESLTFVGVAASKSSIPRCGRNPTPMWIQAVLVELVHLKSKGKQK